MTPLSQELADAPVMAYDPLPPVDSVNLYEKNGRQPTAVDDPSALRVFFRSMLPNFDPTAPVPEPQQG